MKYFLWLIFLLFVGELCYIFFWQKKEKHSPEQIVVKAKNGKIKIVILRNK